jgi:hypothetical protein
VFGEIDELDRFQSFSILMFPGDGIFRFGIAATHSKHFEERSTDHPWSVVLLAVRAMTEPAGRIPQRAIACQARERKRVRLLILWHLW